MATKKELASVYMLAKERILKDTGIKANTHAIILAKIEELTGKAPTHDLYAYLLAYGRVDAPEQPMYSTRQYKPDIAMQQAKRKAQSHPTMISMNSNVKFWSNSND